MKYTMATNFLRTPRHTTAISMAPGMLDLNTRHLRIFVATVEAGSFSRAATRCGMSQPALSRIIRVLESTHHLQLFSRTGRGVRPTAAGLRFHEHAIRILEETDRLGEELAQDHVIEDVNVSIPVRAGRFMMQPLIRRFTTLFPQSSIKVFENLNNDTKHLLTSGVMDIGIFYLPPNPSSLVFECVGFEEMYIVGRRNVVGKSDKPISMSRIAKLPLILPGSRHHLREIIDKAFSINGYTPNIIRELETVHAVLAFAIEGEGATILPYCNFYEEIEQRIPITARKIIKPEIRRKICIAVSSQASSKLVRSTVSMINQIIDNHRDKALWLCQESSQSEASR